jgi:hypothetical protein
MTLKSLKILLIILFCSNQLASYSEVNVIKSQIEPAKKRLALTLKTDKEAYLPCEPIVLSLSAKNISDATVSAYIPTPFNDYDCVVNVFNEKKNQNAIYTEYWKERNRNQTQTIIGRDNMIIRSGKSVRIKPGASYTRRIILNRSFDMTLCADYIVSSSMTIIDSLSNLSTITMEAKPIRIRVEAGESLRATIEPPDQPEKPQKP